MQIGILKTGDPAAGLGAGVPSYPAMMRAVLGAGYAYHEFDVANGRLPGPESTVDAYMITGSASSVNDGDHWIASFMGWLTHVDPVIPLVGICFGHQIMAQAFGGVVETSHKGWGLGLHEYRVASREAWMDDANSFALPVSHRDQVTRPPSTSRVIATSDFCPNAALSYEERRAVSFQAHPEFAVEYAAMLIDLRQRSGVIDAVLADDARASLRNRNDCSRVIGWIRRFLEGAAR